MTSSSGSADPSSASSSDPSATQNSAADEVYSVSLNLKCEKDLNELSREEAIEMLKALPLRVYFTPFGVSEGTHAANSHVQWERAGQPPVAKESKTDTESRKRGRTSEDAGADQVDPRVAAGGSPVKKMRVHGK